MEIIREGNSIDEAIQSVLLEKGWSKEQVQVETLQESKASFFKRQKAIVKVIHLDLLLEKLTEYSESETKKIVVFDGKRMLVMPPNRYDLYQFNPPKRFKVMIEDHEVTAQQSFLPEEKIEVQVPSFEDQLEFIISENKMECTLRFKNESGFSIIPIVKTTEKQFNLYFDELRISHAEWTVQRVVEKMKELNIVYGVDEQAINLWLDQPEKWSEGIIAARGKNRVDGIPTHYELLFKKRNPIAKAKADSKESIDYYGFSPIQTAKVGDELILVTPPTSGENGYNVLGVVDEAIPGANNPLILGDNVHMAPDGVTVIADLEGLVDHVDNKIAMSPLFTVNGDVGLNTGSIRFAGSIVVNGSVLDGMIVEATDNVHITGSVSESTIRAGKNVEIQGNVLMSRIYTGTQNVNGMKQLLWIRHMNEHLQTALIERGHVKDSNVKHQTHGPHGSHSAIEQKHLFVLKWFQEGQTIVKWDSKEDHVVRLKDWMDRAKMAFLGRAESAHAMEKMEEWLFDEGAALELIWLQHLDEPHDAKVFNSHMSTILSTGTVQVIGKSSYISTLVAGDRVIVFEGEGFVRGGMVLAGNAILVKNLGSPSGAHTRCKVLHDDGTIGMDTGYPGVFAWVGHHRTILNSVMKRCLISFDHEKNTIAFGVLKDKPKGK